MAIQKWSDDIILINLAKEPQLGEELQVVIDMVRDDPRHDVVVDFADVDILTSSSIAKLLKLRKVLLDDDNRIALSSVSQQTMQIFKLTALDTVFEFVESQFVALAGLQVACAD